MKRAFLFLVILMSISVSIFSCRMDRERQMEYFLQALQKYQEGDFKAAIAILEFGRSIFSCRKIERGA
jgi:hypothetical protein